MQRLRFKSRVLKSLGTIGFALLAKTASAQDASAILAKADAIRCPAISYKLTLEVATEGEETNELEVSIKGKDKTYVKTLKPTRDKGKNMLMINEDMWVYLPSLKKSVRVSLNQKLTGQAANGDIARQRWSGDYTATLEPGDNDSWKLLLEAQKKGLTYDKIRLWVGKEKFHPLKADYMSKSGKVLKKAEFRAYKNMAGEMRPSETVIVDANKTKERSTITITKMEVADLPDSLYDQNSFK